MQRIEAKNADTKKSFQVLVRRDVPQDKFDFLQMVTISIMGTH